MLAESWSQPDPLTYVFKIRQGVHWHNKPPMNGREFTADDVEYNYQRLTGLGKFSETEPTPMGPWSTLPFESITATDKWTVVFKLTEPNLTVLENLIYNGNALIYPPEVIEETRTAEVPQGKFSDWRGLVGTGPYMLTDVVVGSSHTYTKNPEYWGYDEKYPENRLPYIDEIRSLVMTDVATRLSALRTGKVDYLGVASAYSVIKTIDDADSLRRTRPEIQLWPQRSRSTNAFALPVNKPPFDDIRVRHAMQMALDLETINDTFYKGLGETTPFGQSAVKGYYIPFEEWPEEVKKTYRYDPAGAEALLDAAGYPRGADGIRFKTVVNHHGASDASYKEIAVSYWAEIGVDVEILVWDGATYNALMREGTQEGISGGQGATTFSPVMTTSWVHSSGTINLGMNLPGWNDPKLDAMVEAALAADTVEEQKRLMKEVDWYKIENRGHVWGILVPTWFANWPWLKGFNGEGGMGNAGHLGAIFSRLWLDQDLKEAMGY